MTQLLVAASVSMLIYYKGVRRLRLGILQLIRSPWHHFYYNGDEGSFLIGFSRVAFKEIHEYLYGEVHAQRSGRSRLLNSRDKIDVILFYLGSKLSQSEMHFYSLK